MRTATFTPFVLVLALAGCNVAVQPFRPPAPPLPPNASSVAAAPLPLSAPTAAFPDSMPFRTLIADDGFGRWLATGPEERRVLRSRPELDILLARYTRYVQGPPEPQRPVPGASVGPPMMAPPPGAPTPDPNPQPLPEPLTQLDWDKYQAVAFVDGAVALLTTSRITAIVDQGDKLEVRTARWVAPPSPISGPSPTSRLHVVAIPRSDKAVVFAETVVLDGTAKDGEGGYGGNGGPMMNPKWKAVQNPLQTREMVDQTFRGMTGGGTVTSYSLERRTVAWLEANNMQVQARSASFTSDSEVWVGIAEGDLRSFGAGGGMRGPGPNIGASEPRMSKIIAVFSIEDDHPRPFTMSGKVIEGDPGFSFDLDTHSNIMRIGDTLSFQTRGKPPAGTMKLSITVGTAAPVVRDVPFTDVATFTLTIDKSTLPALTNAEVQPITIETTFQIGQGRSNSRRDVKLLRDRDVLDSPNPPVQGPGTAAEYNPRADETAWDAFARRIAEQDWKGTGLTYKTTDSTFGAFEAVAKTRYLMVPETPVRTYEVRGTFPKTLVPEHLSGTNVDAVFAPRRVIITETAQLPVVVLAVDAYAD